MNPTHHITRNPALTPAQPDSRRHEPHGGKESSHPARVASSSRGHEAHFKCGNRKSKTGNSQRFLLPSQNFGPTSTLATTVQGGAPAPVFGGNGCNLMMPWSAANSGSLCTSVASQRLAVAATNASANETLCPAFNFAASPQRASSECSHWTGCCFTQATSAAADSAPCSFVRMYWSSGTTNGGTRVPATPPPHTPPLRPRRVHSRLGRTRRRYPTPRYPRARSLARSSSSAFNKPLPLQSACKRRNAAFCSSH